MNNEQMKAIIGGIFGTGAYTVWDEEGQAQVKKEKFNIRLYKDLWFSGAIQKLKGNRLGVFLTIAIHADNLGEGWPTQNTIASMLGIGRDAVINALKQLETDGFIEREKTRHKGKYDNTVYKIKFAPDLSKDETKKNKREKSERPKNNHVGKVDTVEIPENQGSHHVGKTDTEKPTRENRHGKTDSKDNLLSFKDDPFIKDDPSFNHHQEETADKKETPAVNEPKGKHDDDSFYKNFRDFFTSQNGEDIKRHDIHYPIFKQLEESIGYLKMIELASKYIASGKHNTPQIAWFLNDGYQNYITTDNRSQAPRKKMNDEKIPSALINQIEQSKKEAAATVVPNDDWQSKLEEWNKQKRSNQ